MIEFLGPHAVFIVSAYIGVGVVTLATIAVVTIDARRQKNRLEQLEAMGVRRRSATTGDKSA